jgi:hypothetical protein
MITIAEPGKEVSEKSLELNVCAELLQYIRSWPGCQKALWLGLTHAQERRAGIDELIRNVGPGLSLMLQFKAPWPSSRVDSLYKFSINERQHEALEQLAGQYPGADYYVFPLYSKWIKADQHAPDLSQDTWLMAASSIPLALLTSLSTPSSGRHRVDLERFGPQVTVTAHSPEVVGEAINAKEYFVGGNSVSSRAFDSFGVPSGYLQEWVGRRDQRDFALRFRGLNALFVPHG